MKTKYIIVFLLLLVGVIVSFQSHKNSISPAPETTPLSSETPTYIDENGVVHNHSLDSLETFEQLEEELAAYNSMTQEGEHIIKSDLFKDALSDVLNNTKLSCNGIDYEIMMANEYKDTLEIYFRTTSPTDKINDMRVQQYIAYLIIKSQSEDYFSNKENDKLLRFHTYYTSGDPDLIPDISTMDLNIISLNQVEETFHYSKETFVCPDDIPLEFAEEPGKEVLSIDLLS